jgi:3-dehydroquinate dehydratase type I
MRRIRKKNPTILKIATECQNDNDSLRLLDILLSLKETPQKYIILGMGSHGLITRVFGSLWGNELIFAPEKANEQSAPGQLTRKQLDNILQTIGE